MLVLVTATSTARGEEPARPLTAGVKSPAEATPPSPASATSPTADERAFAAELERFARLRAFTEQLVAKREAQAFEQAALRQTRIAKLQRELTEREAAMSEREFDEAIALYLKKRELTRELAAAAARAKAAPAGAAHAAPAAPAPAR